MNHVRKAVEGIDDERWAMQAFQKNGRRVRDFVGPFSFMKINRHSSIPKHFECIRGVVVSFLYLATTQFKPLKEIYSMRDKTESTAPESSELNLPFFARFLEGQDNSKDSFMTLKYPSDRDEIDQRIEFMSGNNGSPQ